MQAQQTGTQEREESVTFRLIADLQNAGINVSEIKKLQEAGLNTIGSVLQISTRDMISITGLTEAITEKIKAAASNPEAQKKVVYMDTEGNFRPDRIEDIDHKNSEDEVRGTSWYNYYNFPCEAEERTTSPSSVQNFGN
jgi:hypothetical protein